MGDTLITGTQGALRSLFLCILDESSGIASMLSYPSRAHHIAAVYDACKVLVETYCHSDVLDIYEEHKLGDAYQLQLTCREILRLISEGDIK